LQRTAGEAAAFTIGLSVIRPAFAPARLWPAAGVAIAEVNTGDAMTIGRAPNSSTDDAIIAIADMHVRLSPREREILAWTARGKARAEIAIILSLADETVKDYLTRAMRKLGADNKTHAVAIALTHGLIHL
jgi:DNA-binding CsgD family transcriptional regulator